jgi:hypothetical protein
MTIFKGLNVKLIEPRTDESGTGEPGIDASGIGGPSTDGSGTGGPPVKPPLESTSSNPHSGSPQKSIFEGLNVMPITNLERQQDGSWGKLAARTGKSAIAGVGGGVIDAVTAAYNIPAALTNAANDLTKDNPWEIDPVSGMPVPKTPGERAELPLIPSVTEAIDKGIDQATDGYTRTPEQEKWFQEGIKFATAIASGGGLASLAGKAGYKGAGTLLKSAGSTKPSVIAGAGASGAAMQKAEESHISTPGAIGAGIGAGLATEMALKALNPKAIARRATTLTGFGRGNLNVPAIDAARNLAIDLPGVAATKGVAPAFAHQTMSRFPYFGDKLREKIQTASKQYQKAWDDMLDSVGTPKTEEVSKTIDRGYDLMRNAIPEGAAVISTPILEAIAEVKAKLKTAVHSDPTKKLFSIMREFKKALALPKPALPDEFEKLPPTIQEKILAAIPQGANPVSVKELVRQKVELNKIMKDRNIFDRHDTDSLGFLHALRNGVNQTLEQYGATNPKFMKALKRADERFAQTARREALDDILAGKIVDPKTGEVSYNSLLGILNDRKQQKFLKNQLGSANYKKLEDFVNVAKAMESVKRNNPNPSGSATMGSVMGLITSLALGNFTLPAKVIGGGAVATTLLTSKRFLNLATKFAKEPTEPLAKQIANIVKENTGMSIQSLQKGVRNNRED